MKPKPKSKSTRLSPTLQKSRKTEKDVLKQAKLYCAQAQAALEEGDLELAAQLALRARNTIPPDSPYVYPLELLGEIRIEEEEFEAARELFLQAIRQRERVAPEVFELGDEGKYLWMGQLSADETSEEWYLKGIEVLQRILGQTVESKQKIVHEKTCDVYCSLIELFLTDLCMQDDAEAKAEKYAALAQEQNPSSATALSLLASIRLSQSRPEEASTLLQQSLSHWLGKEDAKQPPYTERLNLVKLLLEVELYDHALLVLETLQREDEENVELWYLYTCAYFHNAGEDKQEGWSNAAECAETCLKLYDRMEWDDEDLRNSCRELLKQIRDSGILIEKEDGEADEEGEDQWEDEDEEVNGDEDVEMRDA